MYIWEKERFLWKLLCGSLFPYILMRVCRNEKYKDKFVSRDFFGNCLNSFQFVPNSGNYFNITMDLSSFREIIFFNASLL